MMKIHTLTMAFLVCCLSAASNPTAEAFRTIKVDGVSPEPSGCDRTWTVIQNHLVWLDETRLLAWVYFSCDKANSRDRKIQSVVAVFDTSGHVISSKADRISSVARGPFGTALISHGRRVDLVDPELHTQKILLCPEGIASCNIFTPSSPLADSDFALCSSSGPDESCDFYRGNPSAKVAERTFAVPATNGIDDPYDEKNTWNSEPSYPVRPSWRVGLHEVWYFNDRAVLEYRNSGGSTGPVTTQRWKPNDNSCTGVLSVSEPKRFLATCNGTHFYTDGDLDFLFGYSRIALFDVASRSIIARIDGPDSASAFLSPTGQLIAVAYADKIRFYRVRR